MNLDIDMCQNVLSDLVSDDNIHLTYPPKKLMKTNNFSYVTKQAVDNENS